jgi:GNAT superfamily N-acetyltransferase
MTVTIRPAVAADVATILRFIRELAVYEREPDAVETTEAMLHAALFGPKPAAEALIAERDGASIGFALFFHTFSTWKGRRGLWLEDLYVSPEARGSGAGAALLKALAGIALDRDCARFEWWVLDWNTPALDFYRAKGAVAQDEWTVQRVSGDALVALAGRSGHTVRSE